MKIVYILLVIAIAISLISPIRYYFADKEIPELPKYTSYETALLKELPQSIKEKAKANKCSNYLLPITEVENNDSSLPNLKEDINLALTFFKGWKLRVSPDVKSKMKKRLDEQIKNWDSMVSGKELGKILSTQKKVLIKTDYSAVAKLLSIPNERGNNLRLIVAINKELTTSELFNVIVSFAHPKSVKRWKDEIEKKKNKIATLKEKSRKGIYSAIMFSIFLIISLMISSVTSYMKKRKIELIQNELLQQIEKRQELIDNGHYVAALELADRYLKYFPNDIDIKAFRERLLDYTNNDPKKAQIAYVEAKKLQLRLSNPTQGMYLTNSEKQELANLLPYNPELKKSYTKLLNYEEESKRENEFDNEYNLILALIEEGKLCEADSELKKLQRRYKGSNKLNNLRIELNEKLEKSQNEFMRIQNLIAKGEIGLAKDDLVELLKVYPDMAEAKELLDKMDNSKMKNGFILKSSEREITIFCKKEILIGRKDDNVEPDIEIADRHISRPHAKIIISENNVTLIDLESSGGTYIKGNKIDKYTLLNDELVTLAKIIDIKISIYRDKNGMLGGIIIKIKDRLFIILISKIAFGEKLERFQKDKSTLYFKSGLAVLINKDKSFILYDGAEVEIGDAKYSAVAF